MHNEESFNDSKKDKMDAIFLKFFALQQSRGAIVAVIVWWLDLQLLMQSVPINTDAMSSNLDQGEV